jgi:predicted CXXCH cytochrome family protein
MAKIITPKPINNAQKSIEGVIMQNHCCHREIDQYRSTGTNRLAGKGLSRWLLIGVFLGLGCWFVSAAEATKNAGPPVPKLKKNNLAPLAATEKAAASHAPFEGGDCTLCHQNKDVQNPGPLTAPVNQQCLSCHEEFTEIMARKSSHVAAQTSCVNCHNPHNAKLPKLLVEEVGAMCNSCHENIKKLSTDSKVKHGTMESEGKCLNCHNPHAANVEHLLVRLPFDLCINCHGQDGVKDAEGKVLTNFKTLLAENPEHHGPVASKDCSACHNPHGSDHFRLLSLEYPAQFYAAYDPKLYALCFDCHEATILTTPETTTLTQFRDGKRNLHYLHVNKADRGRTCRACHEVHASKQPHQIRDAVPYGAKGWLLKINFTQTPTGGSCAKTCHATKSYNNKTVAEPAPQK